MKKVMNLSSNEEFSFDDSVSDLTAVCECYCLANNLGSWFFAFLNNGMNFTESLPIVEGDKTLACGDYCIIKGE